MVNPDTPQESPFKELSNEYIKCIGCYYDILSYEPLKAWGVIWAERFSLPQGRSGWPAGKKISYSLRAVVVHIYTKFERNPFSGLLGVVDSTEKK